LFLFWSIGTGIVAGAGLFSVAVILAAVVTIGLIILQIIPEISAAKLLVIKLTDKSTETEVLSMIGRYSPRFKIDSKSVTKAGITLIIEIKSLDDNAMVNAISDLSGVSTVTLMEHQGEVKN
ncbi:MAG: DUF4956 domain-containing protein, partial [Pseudobutyrivibrio sp.]|nr:DUF4956 domain-containing protein [Pseudobutyrivibrio sp.]